MGFANFSRNNVPYRIVMLVICVALFIWAFMRYNENGGRTGFQLAAIGILCGLSVFNLFSAIKAKKAAAQAVNEEQTNEE